MPRESEMETGEVPNRGVGRLEAYWTEVLERIKKQSEARHSKEGAVAWCEDPLSRDDSAIDADKEQRFPLLKLEQLNDQQRPFADEILKVSSIGISGPFNMMLRSPVMGQRMLLNNRLQMRACCATRKVVTLTNEMKIGLCEQVRVN
jgi:hypothetical protein